MYVQLYEKILTGNYTSRASVGGSLLQMVLWVLTN
jgi:hypothetical protein